MSRIRQVIRTGIRWLPKSLRRDLVLAGVAAEEGLDDCVRYPSFRGTLCYLRRMDFKPRIAVDIGAFKGEWTQELKQVFPETRVLMVEPQQSKRALLRTVCDQYPGTVQMQDDLLGAQNANEVTFHEMEQGSSVFREQSSLEATALKRKLSTLDSLLVRVGETGPLDLLKLDTQGYELEILRGAPAALKRSEFVLLETSLIPINKDCPMILEVMNFMSAHSFRLFDFCGQWRRPDHVLWQVDLMFVREDSRFLPEPKLKGHSFSGWSLSPRAAAQD